MKKNYVVSFLVMMVVSLTASPLFAEDGGLPPMPPMPDADTIKSLPWTDTSLTTNWTGKNEPKGWNAMTVDVEETGSVVFLYPSVWSYNAVKEYTTVTMDKYEVSALMLPIIEVPGGVKNLKVTFDFIADRENAAISLFSSDGYESRHDLNIFMYKALNESITYPITTVTEPTSAEYMIDMKDYPSGVVNVVMMLLDLNPSGTIYGVMNVKVVDADDPTSIIETQTLSSYITTDVRAARVANLPQDAAVEIFSITGGKVGEYKAASSVLNLSLESGLYVVKVTSQGSSKVMKALVK